MRTHKIIYNGVLVPIELLSPITILQSERRICAPPIVSVYITTCHSVCYDDITWRSRLTL